MPPSFEVSEQAPSSSPAGAAAQGAGCAEPEDAFTNAVRRAAQDRDREQVPDQGAIIGYALATWPSRERQGGRLSGPRRLQASSLAFPKAGKTAEAGIDEFTVVGYFKSGMSEYDSTHVYVPLEQAAEDAAALATRRHGAPSTRSRSRSGRAWTSTSWPIGCRWPWNGCSRCISRSGPGSRSKGRCWRRWPIEQSILNILLFIIIAVAGFGILAIFSMIVVEKTRDIGIMKALGASNGGHPGDLPGLRAAAGRRGQRRRAWPAACCSSGTSTRSRRLLSRVPRPQGFRRHHLLLQQDPDPGRAVHGGLDRRPGAADRRAGQHLAGAAGGAGCTRSRRCGSNESASVSRTIVRHQPSDHPGRGEDDDGRAHIAAVGLVEELLEGADRGAGAPRGRPGGRARRVRGDRGGQRVGQEHAAAHPGPARRARRRRGLARRPADRQPARPPARRAAQPAPSGSSSSSTTCCPS